MKRQKEDQNEYAKNIKGEVKFILDVDSGRKGYWCLGCDEEMQAVRFKVEHYKSYFRHDPKDVKMERKCTFSNQNFRHLLAMDILGRTKRIKIPNLYKYSPDGKILIQESKFVEAHSVRGRLTFYENDDGTVLWGKNPDINEKYLLIRKRYYLKLSRFFQFLKSHVHNESKCDLRMYFFMIGIFIHI